MIKCRYFLEYTDIFKATSPIICPNRKCQKWKKNISKITENTDGIIWKIPFWILFYTSIFRYFFAVFFGIFRFVSTVFSGISFFSWKILFYSIFRYLSIIGILEKYRKPVFQIMKKYRNVLGVIVEKYWKILEKILQNTQYNTSIFFAKPVFLAVFFGIFGGIFQNFFNWKIQ